MRSSGGGLSCGRRTNPVPLVRPRRDVQRRGHDFDRPIMDADFPRALVPEAGRSVRWRDTSGARRRPRIRAPLMNRALDACVALARTLRDPETGAGERSRFSMLYNVWSDLRHAARSLSRNPGFTLVAIATLAVGIGANTAIFSLVDAVLLRPLPVEGLARLHVVREDQPRYDMYGAPLSPPEVLDLAEREDVFDAVMGFQIVDRTLTGYGEPERIRVAATLGDFRGVLGVQPVVGRFYRPEQSTDGTHRVAVVSYGLWQRLAGADAAFIGRTLELDGESFEVLGVMPADLRY